MDAPHDQYLGPEIEPPEIEIIEEIGHGSFGKVYKGRCRSKNVAVKVLHKQSFDKRTIAAFQNEIRLMSTIYHPNICLFMGASLTPGKCMIVTELLQTDIEHLLKRRRGQIPLLTKMKMMRDTALGVNWLHMRNPIFIHRDLKSSNLLVDDNFNVKVCDFGLSQLLERNQMAQDKLNAKGTPLWMAPEVMNFEKFNEKCDVYSYGIVLWEVLTEQEPFAQYQTFESFKLAVCGRHERPPISDAIEPSLKRLIQQCWQPDPSKRPNFTTILKDLDEVMIDISIKDPVGRAFWKSAFYKRGELKLEVPWPNFIQAFAVFAGLPQDPLRDLNVRCLQAVLHEIPKEGQDAPQLNTPLTAVAIQQFGRFLDWFGPLKQSTATPPPSASGSDRPASAAASAPSSSVPDNIFERVRTLLDKKWFHGWISTQEAQLRLGGLPSGSFLVRFSSSHPGCYTISSLTASQGATVTPGQVRHQRISRTPNQGFELGQIYYDSLDEIIKESNHLYIPCPGSRFQILFSEGHGAIAYT
eukprot:TRINITY_DN22936_c0_g1_i1.p1 TRINITY_DN22936_c0_g1~~TRINITY_DN22936_c0_g1_i1.p1  ORF type:complete len:525 (-),score=169.82 TRINITY_DN22936_c0_g1_i1:227-1801(-)